MISKISLGFFLSIASTAPSPSSSHDRSLQFLQCITGGGGDLSSCCTANPTDEICTLIGCVDATTGTLGDGCDCGAVTGFCAAQEFMLAFLIPEITDLCNAARECCPAPDSTTNDDFNACISEKGEAFDFSVVGGDGGGIDGWPGLGEGGIGPVVSPGMGESTTGVDSEPDEGNNSTASTNSPEQGLVNQTSSSSSETAPVETEQPIGAEAQPSDGESSRPLGVSGTLFAVGSVLMALWLNHV